MSLRVVTPFINTNIPGAYPVVIVQSQPVGLGLSGVLVIMGEADGGPSYSQVALKNNFFGPNQLAQVQQQYISGNIVDAMSALADPSNDPNITGSANQIYILKTNTSGKASSALAGSYGTLSDTNYGVNGNLYKYQIILEDAEVVPTTTGTTITSYGGTTGATFSVRVNGGPAVVVGPLGSSANQSALLTNLNAAFATAGVDLDTTAGTAPNTIAINWSATPGSVSPVPDATAYAKGYGKSFELIDSTPGDLASLGLTPGLTVSSVEPGVEVNIVRPDINVNQSISANASIALQVGYAGTTGTLTISGGMLTTTVTGGTGANLSINLSQYTTISELSLFIAAQTGYSATNPPSSGNLPPSALDQVTAIGIASTGAGDEPGRIKDSAYSFALAMSTSVLAFTVGTGGHLGLPAPMPAFVFLAGGTLGGTAPIDIVNCLAQMAGINCNIIVPLFSEDATEDILLGETDPTSTYTIAAINAATKNHCLEYSTPSLKKNRICILSYTDNTDTTYLNATTQAQTLSSYRCSLTMQGITQLNSTGTIVTYQPWYTAVLAAGMQAGGFYQSITNKAANIISFIDPTGFNSGDPDEVSAALSAGLLFLSEDTGRAGYWVSDQTTYSFDTNFVYNSIQAVYDSDLIALDLAQSYFQQFCGRSLADVTAASGLSFLTQKMDGYRKLKLIASSSDAPLGFKNASIVINAPEMDVQVEIKLATAIYFIPITINVSQVMQSAS